MADQSSAQGDDLGTREETASVWSRGNERRLEAPKWSTCRGWEFGVPYPQFHLRSSCNLDPDASNTFRCV